MKNSKNYIFIVVINTENSFYSSWSSGGILSRGHQLKSFLVESTLIQNFTQTMDQASIFCEVYLKKVLWSNPILDYFWSEQ